MATATAPTKRPTSLVFTLPTDEFRSLPIPGFSDAKMGSCYVRAQDLPEALSHWMSVNPRVPNRTDTGRLSGPVPKAIMETLREDGAAMALKNAGIYLLVANAEHSRRKGGAGELRIELLDPSNHGLVNGGHTFAAIREVMERADAEETASLAEAFVRLHVMQGVPAGHVVDIAEGLNRSKQVQAPSLENLRGHFEMIKQALRGHSGEHAVAYHEGADGDVWVGEIISFIEMFNLVRYPLTEQPHDLYGRQYKALKEFGEDVENDPRLIHGIVAQLPEILRISDIIRRDAPVKAKDEADFKIGQMKLAPGRNARVGSDEQHNTPLHFIGETTDYRLPNAWLYPMLSAFRQNAHWDSKHKRLSWKVPNKEILANCLTTMVNVCVQEHRNNNQKPEWVGKKDSAYRQCALYVELYLKQIELDQIKRHR